MTVERPSSASDSSSQNGMADNETEPEHQSELSALSAPSPKKKRTCTLTTPHQSAVLHVFLAQSRFPTTTMCEEVPPHQCSTAALAVLSNSPASRYVNLFPACLHHAHF
ncbi:hypothetical protein EV702DRAFT_1219915 [Suillus placidus]|uniref:Uncharacterized protein n=1 Tax=Suillus placidus TaxID=48579 RepID=A0A9P7D3M1_9AGAM|nr:hypothetical protein EV702DRAFT_1219915 [Suillus placidus]